MDQLECKDPNQWHVVNLWTIGGQIRYEKRIIKGHLNWLVVSYGWNNNGKAKGIKKKEAKGENFCSPSPSHSIDPQVHFKFLSSVHHVHEVT